MLLAHEIDPVGRIAIVTVSGELTDEGLFRLYDRLREDAEVGSDFALLIDLRQASGVNVTPGGVSALAQRPPMLALEARRAVVVPSDFGVAMARMYDMLRQAGGGGVAIFRDFTEARRWAEAGGPTPP